MQQSKKIGKQTYNIEQGVSIIGYGAVVGKKEGNGPLGKKFDFVIDDGYFGEKTWEKAETKMQKEAILYAVSKARKSLSDIDIILSGDLLNQCIGSNYAVRDLGIPFLGLYGACSTMAESMVIGSMLIDGNYANNIVCGTSSHFCSSERQFRSPLEYGGQRPFSAQLTATASGMVVLAKSDDKPYITQVTIGKVIDKGVKDILNMGAAMAPGAVDTMLTHFEDTDTSPSSYDLIITGDLGKTGYQIVMDLMGKSGYKLSNYKDCGMMLYDLIKQDAHSGASGCGCSASVMCGHIIPEIKSQKINRVLFIGTGALMSPTSVQQGESIPTIAHAVVISNER